MTWGGDYAPALARACGIAAAAVVAGSVVRGVLASSDRQTRRALWAMLLVPYLTPVLLVGYAYSRYSLSLIRHPAWNELLYVALVWLKLVPVAALALHFAPTPMSPEAIWCHKLLNSRSSSIRNPQSAIRNSDLAFWLRGPGRAFGVAFAAVFLLAFGEFEMASLLGIRSWTVTLFDAQVGGLALGESLRLAAPALAVEAVLLGVVLALILSHRPSGAPSAPRHVGLGAWTQAAVMFYILAALALVTLVPAFVVLHGTLAWLKLMPQVLTLARDVAASVLFGLAAAACAYLVAGWFLGAGRRGAWYGKWLFASAACVPGLLGALALALLALALFQLPGLTALYDSPVPLAVTLALLLLPFAVLLRLLVTALRPGEAVHAARLLAASPSRDVARNSRRLAWHLGRRGQFYVAFLLFCWGYFDLTASSILAPSGMTPVLVRLYNFAHYGQSAALSAMVCVAFAVPFVLLALAMMVRRVVGL